MTVSLGKYFENIFRESFVLELFWEEKIDYEVDSSIRQEKVEKISIFTLLRKFLSKKIRSIFK